MRNDKESKIVISMKHIDNANRMTKVLATFLAIALEGGDVGMLIKHNGQIRDCGFVAHDLTTKGVKHEI